MEGEPAINTLTDSVSLSLMSDCYVLRGAIVVALSPVPTGHVKLTCSLANSNTPVKSRREDVVFNINVQYYCSMIIPIR